MALGRARMVLELDPPRCLRTEVPRTARHPTAREPDRATRKRGGPARPVRCRCPARAAERARHRSLGRDRPHERSSPGALATDRHAQMVHRSRAARCAGPEPAQRQKPTQPRPGQADATGRRSDHALPLFPKGCGRSTPTTATSSSSFCPARATRTVCPRASASGSTASRAADEPTFTVGVIYGPSGCGKSSLVKAGLLPRLARRIVSVYVEATADETEARLLIGLRKQLPGPAGRSRSDADDRRASAGARLSPDQKVLLVLDQFEQWLHAHRREQDTGAGPGPAAVRRRARPVRRSWCGTISGWR